MNKELAEYLKSKNGLKRLINNLKDKYISLNRYSGIVKIDNITKEEANDLSDLLGKTYKEKDNIKTSFKEVQKKINDTKYRNFNWEELFKYYFNKDIISKKDIKQKNSSTYNNFLNSILNNNLNNKYISRLKEITNNNCILYNYIKKLYNKNKLELEINLNNTFHLLNNLPDKPLNLTLFASLTGNPHYLDLNTNTFNIFIKFICFIFSKNIPNNNDETIELLSNYNIYVDYYSNFVITYNLCGNEILDNIKNNKQVFNINLSNVLNMENIDTLNKKVYIFENPSILNILKDLEIPIIITSGMPNMTLYKILDKLIINNNQLYYNGDFDPEGLIIAQKLKNKYPNLQLFCYSNYDYNNCISKEIINNNRLNKLNNIKIKELDEIKKLLINNKYSGYQENNLDNIKNYILKKE